MKLDYDIDDTVLIRGKVKEITVNPHNVIYLVGTDVLGGMTVEHCYTAEQIHGKIVGESNDA